MEDYRIDSHKLIFHPEKVVEWKEKTNQIYPMNCEISLAGACNHRCIFCSADYMGYEPKILAEETAVKVLGEMREKGLKSILFAGTGEPLLNKQAASIINHAKRMGIDTALSTNGVLFTEEVARECMESITWIRFSTSAGTEETYRKVHQGKEGDLERVFRNIASAAEIKRKLGLKTTLGVQIVMIPENMDEVVMLAKKVKELGADQFSVKSFGLQPLSKSELKGEIDRKTFYDGREDIVTELEKLNDENFTAVYRLNRIKKSKIGKNYTECYAMPFHVNIDASGDVWPCCALTGANGMSFGNIHEKTFSEIWEGEQRKNVIEHLKQTKLAGCSLECKLDDMNRYLHELVHPNGHVNFI